MGDHTIATDWSSAPARISAFPLKVKKCHNMIVTVARKNENWLVFVGSFCLFLHYLQLLLKVSRRHHSIWIFFAVGRKRDAVAVDHAERDPPTVHNLHHAAKLIVTVGLADRKWRVVITLEWAKPGSLGTALVDAASVKRSWFFFLLFYTWVMTFPTLLIYLEYFCNNSSVLEETT